MPLNFLRRRKGDDEHEPGSPDGLPAAGTPPRPAEPVAVPGADVRSAREGVPFDALTEEWRLVGRMHVDGRLSDALNRREPIAIGDVQWAPMDGTEPLVPVPGLRSVDPYDLIIVLAGQGSLPEFTPEERAAHRIHKVAYDVVMEVPPFRVVGTIHLHPGVEPEQLLDRSSAMFVPVVDAVATLGDRRMGDPDVATVLVNRHYLRAIEQVDRQSGVVTPRLPGRPAGGAGEARGDDLTESAAEGDPDAESPS